LKDTSDFSRYSNCFMASAFCRTRSSNGAWEQRTPQVNSYDAKEKKVHTCPHLLDVDVVHLVAGHISIIDSDSGLGRIFATGAGHAARDFRLHDAGAGLSHEALDVITDHARLAVRPTNINGRAQGTGLIVVGHRCYGPNLGLIHSWCVESSGRQASEPADLDRVRPEYTEFERYYAQNVCLDAPSAAPCFPASSTCLLTRNRRGQKRVEKKIISLPILLRVLFLFFFEK
jgi:hypothetical protein